MSAIRLANGLRAPDRCLTLAVTSGKGGVGKTAITANLAIALSATGLSVTVLDADLSLANVDVLLGLTPQRTIEHFFRGEATLPELAIEGPGGIRIVPAGSGLPTLTQLGPDEALHFVEGLRELRETCDVLLLDTAAGIGDQVSRMLMLADRVLMVTWPEPTALVDAYAAIKTLCRRHTSQDVGLIVNGVRDEGEARQVHARMQAAARQFLNREVALEGFIPFDEAVAHAARCQRAVVQANPGAPASRALSKLAFHVAARVRMRHSAGAVGTWSKGMASAEIVH